ncbi:MAG: cysteine desulfurase [Clostridiales bacterium]|nr:cysteine desulfurase [Clostridiales bacterium]
MEAYLDNSATTRCCDEAVEMMRRVLSQDYGNPSSMHAKGVDAENFMKDAQKKIAKTLRCKEQEICFTSGGTESNNLAILGVAEANRRTGRHIITSSVEHPSVRQTVRWLSEQGCEVTYLPVNAYGEILLDDLRNALRPDTVLVTLMHVNNEIGALEPVAEAGRIVHENNPKTIFHVDAIQSYGKFPIFPGRMGIDLLSVSGHKIHGPKGSGFLYVKDKAKIAPLLHGGGQQRGLRSGTENVPAIAGLGVAAELAYKNLEDNANHMYEMRERLIEGVLGIEGVSVNGRQGREAAPHIVSVSVDGVRAEVLLHALEDRGIYVSAGSACSSNRPEVSATLTAIGLRKDLLDSTVRLSLCEATTAEEIDYTVAALGELIPMLRRYKRS